MACMNNTANPPDRFCTLRQYVALEVTWVIYSHIGGIITDPFVRWYMKAFVAAFPDESQLVFMTIELAIGVAIGYIPYVDNFGTVVLPHSPSFANQVHSSFGRLPCRHTSWHILLPVISVTRRHKLIMWIFRLAALPIAVVLFVVLTRNFYTSDPYAGKYTLAMLV
ncbi:rhomboid family protein [Salix suchowensis]|nr:rhomboid family protein [Salix suchowensis]